MITNFKIFEDVKNKNLLDTIYNFLERCDIEDDNTKISTLKDIPKYSDRIFITYKTGRNKKYHKYHIDKDYRDTISVHEDKWIDPKNAKISFTCVNMDGFIKKIIQFLINKISKTNKVEIIMHDHSDFYDYYAIKFLHEFYDDIVRFFDELNIDELYTYLNMKKYNL